MLPSACTDDRFFCTTQQGSPNPLHPHQQTCLFLQHTHNPDNDPFFHHHHPHQHPFCTADAAADAVLMEGSTSCSAPNIGARPAKAVTRKNPAKRDRHSKICTAQGTRDRRMRLSLDIARKFFDLQDLLGFDKASKTVEWLLLKSRPAIEQLTAAAQSDAVASAAHAESAVNLAAGDTPESSPDTDPKAKALPRKTAVYVLGKESRGRARERAKERACRRRRVGAGEESGGILSLSSWSPNSSAEVDQPPATATAALGDIFGCSKQHQQQQDGGNGFPHETQFEDWFRFHGKGWEGYSPI